MDRIKKRVINILIIIVSLIAIIFLIKIIFFTAHSVSEEPIIIEPADIQIE